MVKLPKTIIYVLIYLVTAGVLAARVVAEGVSSHWEFWVPIGLWLLGGLLGFLILYLDRLVDIYYGNPQSKLSLYVKDYFTQRKFKEGWQLLMYNQRLQLRLTFRSALFQGIWVLLLIFTMTSTTSLFGKGFVLGLGLHLLLEEWRDYLADREYLKKWLFWQINRPINYQELRIYMIIMTIIAGLGFLRTF
jgi:hypothetical protein